MIGIFWVNVSINAYYDMLFVLESTGWAQCLVGSVWVLCGTWGLSCLPMLAATEQGGTWNRKPELWVDRLKASSSCLAIGTKCITKVNRGSLLKTRMTKLEVKGLTNKDLK